MLQLHALSVCNHFVTNRNQVCFLGYDPFVHPQCDSFIEVQKWPPSQWFPRGLPWPQCPKLWQGGLGSDPFGIHFRTHQICQEVNLEIYQKHLVVVSSDPCSELWRGQNCGEAKLTQNRRRQWIRIISIHHSVSNCITLYHFQSFPNDKAENSWEPQTYCLRAAIRRVETRSGAPLVWCFESSPQCPARRHASEFHCWRGPANGPGKRNLI